MESFEALLSPRVGEVRWSDLRAVIDADAASVRVTVLARGAAPAVATVEVGQRWAGRGWARMFCCPRCREPANVLRAVEGELLCARCHPTLTASQRCKNTAAWTRFDGALEHRLLRTVSKARAGEAEHLAAELISRDEARVDSTEQRVRELIEGSDGIRSARPAASRGGWRRCRTDSSPSWREPARRPDALAQRGRCR